jgi:hypothetical protein
VQQTFAEVAELERGGFIVVALVDEAREFRPPTDGERAGMEAAYAQWLPTEHDFARLSADEVGLWLQITDTGRSEWRKTLPSDYEQPPLWRVGGDETDVVTVWAEDIQSAEKGIASWSQFNPEWAEAIESRRVEPLPEYMFRSDRIIRDGVKVTFKKIKRVWSSTQPVN